MANLLSAHHLSLTIEDKQLFKNMSFELAPGSVTMLLGENGAGKTSLFKMIMGEIHADSGSVILAEAPIETFNATEKAKQIAFLPQENPINFALKVEDVVAMGRIPFNESLEVKLRSINHYIQRFDLNHFKQKSILELSGGEQQRVHLARVFLQAHKEMKPSLLFLDEPTMALDYQHQQMLSDAIKDYADQGGAVLLTCHDLNFLLPIATHLLAIRNGELLVSGSIQNTLTEALLKDVFNFPLLLRDDGRGGCVAIR